MKIDLNIEVKDLSGIVIKDSNLGKILGNQLVSLTKGDALKYYDWAVKLHKGEILEVDRSDFDKIKNFVNESENISILVKAPILIILNKAEKFEESNQELDKNFK